ncbi:MAG: hypothetical protein HY275_07185 [Gemmatimonadetes bacterium]|nr:hypothetical protein [Gemmatimonadota bacterium]
MTLRARLAVTIAAASLASCWDPTAPSPTPFARGELEAVINTLSASIGGDPGPYTAAAALQYAETAGEIQLDSVITTPAAQAPLGGRYKAVAVLMNIKVLSSGFATSSKFAMLSVIGWDGFHPETGTVDRVMVVSLHADSLLWLQGTGITKTLDGHAGFASLANLKVDARFQADSGSFSASRWDSGVSTLCLIPGSTFGDICTHALGTLDGTFEIAGISPGRNARVVVRPVSFSGLPLVVMNWFATL